jgi:hypothetical protein
LELEVQYDADEAVEEKPIPRVSNVAARAIAPIDDQEPDIAKWVDDDGKMKSDRHVPNPALPLATPTGINAAKAAAVAVPATHDRQPKQSRWHEFEVVWEGTDLLLASSIGVALIVVLCMVWPMIPWPDWHWHPIRWYWTRICWYWTYRSWMKLAVIGFLAALVTLLLLVRARRLGKVHP